MNLKDLIAQYLSENKHMQLATVKDGQPWLCTVYFSADDNFDLYWSSSRDRRHSLEILNDSTAAVTVVRDTERKQALQMTGNAHEVSDEELEHAHALYCAKYGPKDYDLEEMKKRGSDARSYWVFKPSAFEFWDEVNFPDNPKQRYRLDS